MSIVREEMLVHHIPVGYPPLNELAIPKQDIHFFILDMDEGLDFLGGIRDFTLNGGQFFSIYFPSE